MYTTKSYDGNTPTHTHRPQRERNINNCRALSPDQNIHEATTCSLGSGRLVTSKLTSVPSTAGYIISRKLGHALAQGAEPRLTARLSPTPVQNHDGRDNYAIDPLPRPQRSTHFLKYLPAPYPALTRVPYVKLDTANRRRSNEPHKIAYARTADTETPIWCNTRPPTYRSTHPKHLQSRLTCWPSPSAHTYDL